MDLNTHRDVLNSSKGTHPVMTGLRYKSNGDGTGSWLARYNMSGKERAIGLGVFPEVSLKDARDQHKDNRAKIRLGTHPLIEREEKTKTSSAALLTIEDVVRDAHSVFVDGWKNGGKRNGFMPKMEAYVFPKYGHRPVNELDGDLIAEMCRPFWQNQKSIADKILKHLSKVIGWAAAKKIKVDRMAVKDARKILGHSRYRETPTKAMDWEAVPTYYRSLGESMSDLGQRFYMLTGVRTMNAAALRWEEINGDVWHLDADRMKRSDDHMVPLSDEAMRVLEFATRFYDNPTDRTGLVFRSKTSHKTGHVSYNSWTQQLRRHGINATAHGFRTSFKMWGTINNIASETVLEECLHHKARGNVELAYLRGHLLPIRRPVFEAWAKYLCAKLPDSDPS